MKVRRGVTLTRHERAPPFLSSLRAFEKGGGRRASFTTWRNTQTRVARVNHERKYLVPVADVSGYLGTGSF